MASFNVVSLRISSYNPYNTYGEEMPSISLSSI